MEKTNGSADIQYRVTLFACNYAVPGIIFVRGHYK